MVFEIVLSVVIVALAIGAGVLRMGWLFPRFGRWTAARASTISPRVGRWLLPDERAEQIEREGR